MSFASTLDSYCSVLNCTNKEIADRCGVSQSSLSRYRKGERTPAAGSQTLVDLANGIARLYEERGIQPPAKAETILSSLESGLRKPRILGMGLGARLDALMSLLNIRNSELAELLGVDPSYVSRIRSDQRMPAEIPTFIETCSRLAARRCRDRNELDELMHLVDSAGDTIDRSHLDLDSNSDLAEVIAAWLLGNNIVASDVLALEGFFEKMNDLFFLEGIDELRGLSCPLITPVVGPEEARFFYGTDRMREVEDSFFAVAVANRVPMVSLSSDMPPLQITPTAQEMMRHVCNMTALAKAGCHVNIVHSVERPLHETIIALEQWLPLYVSGAATPYYLKGVTNRLFCHVNYVCDACVLASEAVMGHQEEGRYYLTTRAEDIAYYGRKMQFILDESVSLLEIYRESNPDEKAAFEATELQRQSTGTGKEVLAGKYENLHIVSYVGNCAVISVACDPPIHFVVRHPKIRYVIGHMG